MFWVLTISPVDPQKTVNDNLKEQDQGSESRFY